MDQSTFIKDFVGIHLDDAGLLATTSQSNYQNHFPFHPSTHDLEFHVFDLQVSW